VDDRADLAEVDLPEPAVKVPDHGARVVLPDCTGRVEVTVL